MTSSAPAARPRSLGIVAAVVCCVVLAVALATAGRWTRDADGATPPAGPPATGSPPPDLARAAGPVLEAYAAAKRAAQPPALVATGPLQAQEGDWEAAVGDNNKLADATGHYRATVVLPDTDGDGVVLDRDGTSSATTVISAQDAFEDMAITRTDCQGCTDLAVTGAVPATMSLSTAEGPFTVPAWRFSLAGTAVTILRSAVPAAAIVTVPPVPSTPPAPGTGQAIDSFTLAADGRTLTLHFTGTPDTKGPCGADYHPELVEAADAVVVTVIPEPHGGGRADVACPAIAQLRSTTVTLDSPLAGRALLNLAGGQPVPTGAPPAR